MYFISANETNYKRSRTGKVKYIVIHFTANDGDSAKGNANYFSRNKNLKASAHYFVDENEIWQSVKEEDTAYHCGAATYLHRECRNDNSIGIELCSGYDGDYKEAIKNNTIDFSKFYFKDNTVANAGNLTKELMVKYNIPVENVVRHYDVSGKYCPAPLVSDITKWNNFKKRLIMKEAIKLSSGNDIDYALKVKYGITFDSVESERQFIQELDRLRAEDGKVYWVLYKLANK